jgi:hypothetical protein
VRQADYEAGGEGGSVEPRRDTKIDFLTKGTITLAPGEVHALTVSTTPPAPYEISFALFGDTHNASLDQAKIIADADGTATVQLKAPTTPTEFQVRATITDGPSIEVAVAVSDKGSGTIHVVPVYTGTRKVTEWEASVIVGSTCKAVKEALPMETDTPFTATAPVGEVLTIHGVPAGPNLAVVLRAGSFLWGCADEPTLQAEKELEVKVTVLNRPMNLLSTDLDLTFSFGSPEPEVYATMLSESADLLAGALLPLTTELAAAELLSAMEAAAPPGTASSFQQQRQDMGWDALVEQQLAGLPLSLQEKVKAWTLAELGPKGDPAVPPTSTMAARLTSLGEASGKALLGVSKLGAIDAVKAGIPEDHLVSWTADASDTAMLGGSIYWLPSRYAGASAMLSAKAELPSVSSMAEALSQVLGCGVLAAAMGGFEGCDTQCTATLCNAALGSRWESAMNASAESGVVGEISINASGLAEVDDVAAPVFFDGKCLGTISVNGLSAKIEGTVIGVTPIPPPP